MEEAGDDAAYIAAALGDVARARGMVQLAKETGFREKVCTRRYRAMEIRASLTVLKVIKALGLKLTAKVA
jgi:probable addiction module antidote protein